MSRMPEEVWSTIKEGLPEVPTKEKHMKPIPEILRVIEMCLDERVEYFDIAVKLAKFVYDSNPVGPVKNWYGSVCYDAKNWKESYEVTIDMMREYPCEGTFFNAAKGAYKYGKLDEAENFIKTAIALEPKDKSKLMDLAVYVVSSGRFDEGFDILNSIPINELESKDATALDFNKGWHEIRRGNFKKGMK